jgi:hypothetical protein
VAIDTRDKRASVVCIACGSSYPTADGSLNQGDRQHVLREYRGILAAAGGLTWTTDEGTIQLFTSANYANVTFVFEATMKANAGTVYARAYNITDGAALASSQVSTTSATKVRVRSGTVTPTDAKQYRAEFARDSGAAGEKWGAQIIAIPI